MASTTWNTSDRTNVTLSGGNLTATGTTAGNGGVRSVAGFTSSKYYFEYTCTTWAGLTMTLGVANLSASLSADTTNAAAIYAGNGFIYVNNAQQFSPGSFSPANGDTICVALDLVGKLIWFRKGAAGNWNGTLNGSPAAGTGGLDISSIAGSAIYALMAHNAQAAVITANFGGSAFVGAVPSGFNGTFGPPTQAQATQIALEQWAQGTPRAQLTQVAVEMWAPGGTTTPLAVMTQIGLEQWAVVAAAQAAQARVMVMA